MKIRTNQKGFTLIELLTVIAIIGILATLAMSAFSLNRANAAYAVVQRVLQDARVGAEAAVVNPENAPGAVTLVNQQVSGPLTNASAKAFLPAVQVPRSVSFSVSFDPACQDAGCQSAFLEARHTSGKRYQQWIRFGDGIYVPVELAGDGW